VYFLIYSVNLLKLRLLLESILYVLYVQKLQEIESQSHFPGYKNLAMVWICSNVFIVCELH
jgi:hypothetical protein